MPEQAKNPVINTQLVIAALTQQANSQIIPPHEVWVYDERTSWVGYKHGRRCFDARCLKIKPPKTFSMPNNVLTASVFLLLLLLTGVQKIMVPGTSVKSSKEALRLTRIYPGIIYSTAGIHPHDSKSIIEEPSTWHEFEVIASAPECVAIGPCGLDYQRDFSEPCTQKDIFERQLKLACQLQKPILIHERSAQEDVLEILSK